MRSRLSKPAQIVALLSATALLAACGTTRLPEDKAAAAVAASPVPVVTASPAAAPAAQPAAAPQSSVATVNLGGTSAASAATAALAAVPGERIVFFDLDSYVIKDDFKPLLDAYARVLAANSGRKLLVEGHTDERGGREYNLALGQKRAAAVVSSLRLLGVPESQMEAVSFGKERPAAQGSDEAAWAKNRRAELKDR